MHEATNDECVEYIVPKSGQLPDPHLVDLGGPVGLPNLNSGRYLGLHRGVHSAQLVSEWGRPLGLGTMYILTSKRGSLALETWAVDFGANRGLSAWFPIFDSPTKQH